MPKGDFVKNFSISSQIQSVLDMKATQRSDYLDAVIKETMRLWPMIPGPLERYLGKPIEVNGLVCTARVLLHQLQPLLLVASQKSYPEPEKWNPDRWLEADREDETQLDTIWLRISHMPRQSNLALTELKYMLGAIFRNMRSVQPKAVPWEPIELADVFAAGSRSGHCWLRFELDSDAP